MENISEQKKRLLESAKEIIEQEGLKGLTIQKLIERCSIGKTTFYRLFPTKKDLLMQLRNYGKSSIKISSLKDQIALKARDNFVKYGFNNIDMDTIAKAVGLNRVTLYRYFSSKEELFEYCIETEFSKIKEIVSNLLYHIESPEDLIVQYMGLVDVFCKQAVKNHMISDVWNQTLRNPKIKALSKDLNETFADMFYSLLERGSKKGIFNKGIDIELISKMLVIMQNGLMFTLTFETDINRIDKVVEKMFETVLKEIKI